MNQKNLLETQLKQWRKQACEKNLRLPQPIEIKQHEHESKILNNINRFIDYSSHYAKDFAYNFPLETAILTYITFDQLQTFIRNFESVDTARSQLTPPPFSMNLNQSSITTLSLASVAASLLC